MFLLLLLFFIWFLVTFLVELDEWPVCTNGGSNWLAKQLEDSLFIGSKI